jgi:hypothetical protein
MYFECLRVGRIMYLSNSILSSLPKMEQGQDFDSRKAQGDKKFARIFFQKNSRKYPRWLEKAWYYGIKRAQHSSFTEV